MNLALDSATFWINIEFQSENVRNKRLLRIQWLWNCFYHLNVRDFNSILVCHFNSLIWLFWVFLSLCNNRHQDEVKVVTFTCIELISISPNSITAFSFNFVFFFKFEWQDQAEIRFFVSRQTLYFDTLCSLKNGLERTSWIFDLSIYWLSGSEVCKILISQLIIGCFCNWTVV